MGEPEAGPEAAQPEPPAPAAAPDGDADEVRDLFGDDTGGESEGEFTEGALHPPSTLGDPEEEENPEDEDVGNLVRKRPPTPDGGGPEQ